MSNVASGVTIEMKTMHSMNRSAGSSAAAENPVEQDQNDR